MSRAMREAERLMAQYGESDPELLAEKMGVLVLFCDLPESVEGFCQCLLGQPIIYLAGRLPPERRRTVCGHELGHLVLHHGAGDLLSGAPDPRMEREADLFCAALLLRDPPEDCCDVQSIVRATGLPERAVRRLYDLP